MFNSIARVIYVIRKGIIRLYLIASEKDEHRKTMELTENLRGHNCTFKPAKFP